MRAPELTLDAMKQGQRYNWQHDPFTQLVYLGHNWSGNGYWHQFAKVESPEEVWCEVLTSDLHLLEKASEPLDLSFAERPIAGQTAVLRRQPLKAKPQREKRHSLTDEDEARIRAAAERRGRRNARRIKNHKEQQR